METKFLKLIEVIDTNESDDIVIAIDGNCGSGKTYLSEILEEEYDCNVIHMDDFFLPMHIRTDDRLSEIAGNFHYERFEEEVLKKLHEGILSYKVYDCGKDEFVDEIIVEKKRLTVIEGSYSQSHGFHKYYDINVCLSCDEETQMKRIRERSSEELFKLFTDVWIPMENRYIEETKLKEKSDLLITT